MFGNIVRITHPKVNTHLGPFRALHFEWRGRPYYLVLSNVGAGRTAFGHADGIKVIETCKQVMVPQYVVEDTATLVDSLSSFEGRTHRFLQENSEWFRAPDRPPTMSKTSLPSDEQVALANRGFGT